MKWDQIIPDIRIVSAEEAKDTLHTIKSHSLHLVDVRQIREYNHQHLPGALSLPLVTLTDGRQHLDKRKPVLLYSQHGNRSLMAARWLHAHDYEDIAVIRGGIDAWNEVKAFGHYGLNLDLFQPDADFPDAVTFAYAMEEGLRQFYIHLAKETDDELFKDLYRELAQKAKLLQLTGKAAVTGREEK
jgi:rhodanese-related sulfurtransferase